MFEYGESRAYALSWIKVPHHGWCAETSLEPALDETLSLSIIILRVKSLFLPRTDTTV
jgi:hypothetical protein